MYKSRINHFTSILSKCNLLIAKIIFILITTMFVTINVFGKTVNDNVTCNLPSAMCKLEADLLAADKELKKRINPYYKKCVW